MTLAEKITDLRKRNGWSQEDVAARLNVSRQAVAKWEGAQSIPSLDKILQLSELFAVSTDYLLKDNLEFSRAPIQEEEPAASISLQQAGAYLNKKQKTAPWFAFGILLDILSPVPLLLLIGASQNPSSGTSEEAACAYGCIALLLMIASSVGLFLWIHHDLEDWKFIEDGDFTLAYGAAGMVRERQKKQSSTHMAMLTGGIILCILCAVPIFLTLLSGQENGMFACAMVSATLCLAGLGTFLLVWTTTISDSMHRLLGEGDFSPSSKRISRILEPVSACWWLGVTAIYLLWSFSSNAWKMTWIVWPPAGLLYAGIVISLKAWMNRSKNTQV